MDRQRELHIASALNEAIWLRDNAADLPKTELYAAVKALGAYRVFSSRQIVAITNGLVSSGIVSSLINKSDRTGGNLNPGTLDILRTVLYSRADKATDYKIISEAVSNGTSQGMVSKLTGVSQGSISKYIRRVVSGRSIQS